MQRSRETSRIEDASIESRAKSSYAGIVGVGIQRKNNAEEAYLDFRTPDEKYKYGGRSSMSNTRTNFLPKT